MLCSGLMAALGRAEVLEQTVVGSAIRTESGTEESALLELVPCKGEGKAGIALRGVFGDEGMQALEGALADSIPEKCRTIAIDLGLVTQTTMVNDSPKPTLRTSPASSMYCQPANR